MQIYSNEEKLDLTKQVALTKDVYKLVRDEKTRLKKLGKPISMAKIVCNLIIEKYGRGTR